MSWYCANTHLLITKCIFKILKDQRNNKLYVNIVVHRYLQTLWWPRPSSIYGQHQALRRLTLNMLNCFKDRKRCIHILCHILHFIQQMKIKFTMEQPYLLTVLYCQYHVCWCSGDYSYQGINRHDIDHQKVEFLSPAWDELKSKQCFYPVDQNSKFK